MAFKERLKTFIQECIRVFRITRKPTGDELKIIVKVSGIGILVIGLIGFTVNIIWEIIA
ncbi:MAG: protein translocase SEC61 complex subunit gamma [Candidatus Woesearchaeota archaeon]|nr:protein translocase SEC61 complex subunit gamma [Candidatus Woesearchaeota archaeon]